MKCFIVGHDWQRIADQEDSSGRHRPVRVCMRCHCVEITGYATVQSYERSDETWVPLDRHEVVLAQIRSRVEKGTRIVQGKEI